MSRWICPEDGARFLMSSGLDNLREKFRIIRADGSVEIHVVDIGCDEQGEFEIVKLNKGDSIEPIYP